MRYAEQLRAARALLGWNQDELARRAEVGVATIRRMESQSGQLRGIADTIWRLQTCLEEAGVLFISSDEQAGPGVRLRRQL
jgi:transcriptional regulator with XRE-family HTH domain